jgi:AP endonuclease-2
LSYLAFLQQVLKYVFLLSGWNTKLSARETNYGTRIDYILITPGLIPWIKAANIQPEIKGSDHCPVYIDLHDEIIAEDGTRTKLQDVLGNTSEKEPPRLATKFWEEHAGKQMSLDKFFFGKKVKEAKDLFVRVSPMDAPQLSGRISSSEVSTPIASNTTTATSTPHPEAETVSECSTDAHADMPLPLPSPLLPSCPFATTIPDSLGPPTSTASETTPTPTSSSPPAPTPHVSVPASTTTATPALPPSSSQPRKRKIVPESQLLLSSSSTSKKKKMSKAKKSGQAKLSSFFDKPPPAMTTTTKASSSSNTNHSKTSICIDGVIHIDDNDIVDEDSVPPLSSPSSSQNFLSLSQSSFHSQNKAQNMNENGEDVGSGKKKEETKQIWNSVFLNTNDVPKPKCLGHGEPAKEYTVNKQGVNKGKKFWLCSR